MSGSNHLHRSCTGDFHRFFYLIFNDLDVGGAPGEIIRAARSPCALTLRVALKGDRHRRYTPLSSNSLVFCREFAFKRQMGNNYWRFLAPQKLVRPERFELPTSWFVARHSIQLNYGRLVTCRPITILGFFPPPPSSFIPYGGEGGIRTLDTG